MTDLSILRSLPLGDQYRVARTMIEDVYRRLMASGMRPCDVVCAGRAAAELLEPMERDGEARTRFTSGVGLEEARKRQP